eukprot:gene1663-433_t
MKLIISALIFVMLTMVCQSKEFNIQNQLIAGGTKASQGEIPYMVALTQGGETNHFCGGTLIDSTWILTAAHCFDGGSIIDNLEETMFVIDRLNIPSRTGGIVMKGKRVLVHPQYDPADKTMKHDIALVELATPVPETATIKYAIPHQGASVQPGSSVVVSGWGMTHQRSFASSDDLLTARIPLQDTSKCNLSGIDASIKYCAFSVSPIQNTCQGDTGGPLVWTSNNANYLIGIVSYGASVDCGSDGSYGVYTKVESHIPWIKKYLTVPSASGWGCFGISASDPSVCSGRGNCVSTDKCSCNKGYTGNECQTIDVDFGSGTVTKANFLGTLLLLILIYLLQ